MGLQVVVADADRSPEVLGLPASVRLADRLRGLSPSRLLLCGDDPAWAPRWARRMRGLPWAAWSRESPPLRDALLGSEPLLVLSPDAAPGAEALRRLTSSEVRAAAADADGPLGLYYPRAAELLERLPEASRSVPREALDLAGAHASSDAWPRLRGADSLRAEEERLFAALPQDSDGYLARLDRAFSIALSRRLVRLPVTPNQITTASLLLGLLGAWLLADIGRLSQAAGALLLLFCCVLDGCDGEIARLKLLCSPAGGRYDVISDNIVHVAIFAAIPIHLQRKLPGVSFARPGLVLLAGVLLSMFWVWRLVLRSPERTAAARVIERIASRDFIYLVAVLAVADRLEWFLWAAAVGSHLFWVMVVALSLGYSPSSSEAAA
ncbi:MAG TPA: CDP-alcohol phosphatidyltransferase family protein [Elusimicrobiota bacterium]|jgi:phosphatidylglycerophosphate synthase|nr:CDP-alcohol phosphatidyltransferase family protein [Elusimicrobiota bacterium]